MGIFSYIRCINKGNIKIRNMESIKHKKTCLYLRVSSVSQNLERQQTDKDDYEFCLEDKCSGTIPIFEREKGRLLKVMIEEGSINEIHIHSIDRSSRNLKSLLDFIDFSHAHGVSIFIKNLGLRTLGEDGKTSYVVKMIISIMGSFAEIENEIRKERQKEGIEIAKIKGKYKNRIKRGKETPQRFLMKHSKAVDYLNMGMKGSEVIRLLDGKINKNTITKIRKYISNEIYDGIKGKEFVEGLKQQPVVSPMEFVDIMGD